ncbi:hypothetical protein JRQ81_013654, partial [Phrynocephalus forsythii]
SDLERSLHTLDFCRTLLFYISHTASFRKITWLFVRSSNQLEGLPISSQTISQWISTVITLAYEAAKTPLPHVPKGHSTRSIASSTAFLRGVYLTWVCKDAMWSTPSTFAAHYKLD